MRPRFNWIVIAAVAALSTSLLVGCGEKEDTSQPAPPQVSVSTPPAPATGAGSSAGTEASTGTAAVKTAATVTEGKKDLKEAVCVICAAKSGATAPEPVVASIEYKGKGYYFCNDSEKAEFISNPDKYAATAK